MPSRCLTPLLVQLPEHFCHAEPTELAPLIPAGEGAPPQPAPGCSAAGGTARHRPDDHSAAEDASAGANVAHRPQPRSGGGACPPRPTAPSGQQFPTACDSADQLVKAAGIIGKPGFRPGARTAPGGRGRSGPWGRSGGPDQDAGGPARPGSLAADHDRRPLIRRLARLTGALPWRRTHRSAHPRRARAGRTAGIRCDGYKGTRARAARRPARPGPCRVTSRHPPAGPGQAQRRRK